VVLIRGSGHDRGRGRPPCDSAAGAALGATRASVEALSREVKLPLGMQHLLQRDPGFGVGDVSDRYHSGVGVEESQRPGRGLSDVGNIDTQGNSADAAERTMRMLENATIMQEQVKGVRCGKDGPEEGAVRIDSALMVQLKDVANLCQTTRWFGWACPWLCGAWKARRKSMVRGADGRARTGVEVRGARLRARTCGGAMSVLGCALVAPLFVPSNVAVPTRLKITIRGACPVPNCFLTPVSCLRGAGKGIAGAGFGRER
jgi:hypothetical protein